MGNQTKRNLMEVRLNPLRGEMTDDRFTRLISDALQIEARCKEISLFPADGTPIMPGFEFKSPPTLTPKSPITGKGESTRHRKIIFDLTTRLRAACSHCTELEFAGLIERMARIQIRGESDRARLVLAIDRQLTPA